MDPWPTKDHLVSRRIVEHYKYDEEVDSGGVNWYGDISQCEFLLPTESDEDRRVVMKVRLFYVHLPQGTEENDIGG